MLRVKKSFKNIVGKDSGIALTIFDNSLIRKDHQTDKLTIVVSYSDVMTLPLD